MTKFGSDELIVRFTLPLLLLRRLAPVVSHLLLHAHHLYKHNQVGRRAKSWITGRSWGAGMSTPQHLHARSASPYLLRQPPPRLTPTARLRNSRALEANTSTSPRLQHASQTPDLHTSTSPGLKHASRAPDLHTSTLFTTTTLGRVGTGRLIASTSIPPCPRTRSTPPELQISIPLQRHVCTPAAHLYTSTSPRPHHTSRAPDILRHRPLEANTSTSPCPQHTSQAPDLLRQTPPRPYAGNAPLELHHHLLPLAPPLQT